MRQRDASFFGTPTRRDDPPWLHGVSTPTAKDTVRRQEFAELAGISLETGARDASFRCIATVYRNELSDEVMDISLDRLSRAPLETVLGISHYMHGEVCRVKPDSTAFPLRQSGGIHIRINFGLERFGRRAASHALGRRSASGVRLRKT